MVITFTVADCYMYVVIQNDGNTTVTQTVSLPVKQESIQTVKVVWTVVFLNHSIWLTCWWEHCRMYDEDSRGTRVTILTSQG